MRGTNVTVIRSSAASTDAHGNTIKTEALETVSDVLVNPIATANANDRQAEQDGITIRLNLAFPKTYQEPLRGCRVIIPCLDASREWFVVGDPQPIPHNCPTRWNYPVEVVFNDG